MNQPITSLHATTPQLLKATGIALASAAVLLVIAVLPAEYGVDPIGAGRLLGLTALSGEAETAPVQNTPATSAMKAAGSGGTPSFARQRLIKTAKCRSSCSLMRALKSRHPCGRGCFCV